MGSEYRFGRQNAINKGRLEYTAVHLFTEKQSGFEVVILPICISEDFCEKPPLKFQKCCGKIRLRGIRPDYRPKEIIYEKNKGSLP